MDPLLHIRNRVEEQRIHMRQPLQIVQHPVHTLLQYPSNIQLHPDEALPRSRRRRIGRPRLALPHRIALTRRRRRSRQRRSPHKLTPIHKPSCSIMKTDEPVV
jgi:hypothetical protein